MDFNSVSRLFSSDRFDVCFDLADQIIQILGVIPRCEAGRDACSGCQVHYISNVELGEGGAPMDFEQNCD